jgi:hypothetical protein
MGQNHKMIIITIVLGFSTFLLGYSLPPFLEVGFAVEETVESGSGPDSDLMKQYEDLYKDDEE